MNTCIMQSHINIMILPLFISSHEVQLLKKWRMPSVRVCMYLDRDVHILYLKPHHYAATTPHTQDPFRHRLTCVQKVAAASLVQMYTKE